MQDMGFTMFLSVLFANVAGVLVDHILSMRGLPTITDVVRRYHIAGIPIVGLQAIGAFGLAMHFWGQN